MRRNAAIFSIVLFLTQFQLPAQSLNQRHYDPRNGLASSESYHAIQDSEGYIWIATDAGVNRFDGKHFTTFNRDNGLPDNTIFNLYEDHKKRIWFLSYSGALSYYSNGRIHLIAANDSLRKIINYKNEVVVSFAVDSGDTLWLSYNFRKSYLKIHPQNNYGHFEEITDTTCERNFIFTGGLSAPMYTTLDRYTRDGCTRVRTPDGTATFSLTQNRSEVSTYVRLLAISKNEFVFSIFNRVYHYKNNRIVAHQLFPKRVIALALDRHKRLWIGVYQYGVFMYKNTDLGQKSRHLFPSLSVTHVLEDHEQGYWFTTLEKGLFYSTGTEARKIDLLPEDRLVTSLKAAGDKLYAGTADGEVMVIVKDSLSEEFRIGRKFAGPDNYALVNIELYNNKLFLSSSRLSLYTEKGQKMHDYRFREKNFYANSVKQTADKNLVVAAMYAVLYLDENGALLQCDSFPVRINCLELHPDGSIYVGCLNGLWKLKNHQAQYLGRIMPSVASPVTGLTIEPGGKIWVSTKGSGLTCIDGKHVKVYNHLNGLSSNCTAIAADESERIWVGTPTGLFLLDPASGKIIRYNRSHGLRTSEIKCLQYFSGHIFAGTQLGIDYIPASPHLLNYVPPPIIITGVNGEATMPPFNDSEINLSADNRDIEFSFTGFNFKSLDPATYRYRLKGYDQRWQSTSNENVKYTNLPSGSYTFEVLMKNNDEVISARAAKVRFSIATPWWKQTWALLLGALVLIAAFTTSFLLLMRYAKKRQQRRAQIGQLLIESRLTALRAQMNPHFIFNVINSIQHFILLNNKDKAYDYLARFSRLIRMVLDNSRDTSVTLENEINLLTLYTDLEKLRFEQPFEVSISVNTSESPHLINLPNMLIQPYIENAIIHGIAPMNSNGKITIDFFQNNELLNVTITDNGIGRKRSKEIRRSSAHRSTGMLITEERMRVIGELVRGSISITVNDLVDETGAASGTRVEIKIPLV